MINTERSNFFWKILWVIGLIIFSYVSFEIKTQIQQNAKITYSIQPIYWTNFIISVLFGIYFSILFVKKWKIILNIPFLLCVFFPCLIISLAFPLLITFPAIHLPPSFTLFLTKINSYHEIGIAAGMSFILGIFNQKKSNIQNN